MDISQILPMLMNKDGESDERMQTLLKAATGGMGGAGAKPDISMLMNLAQKNKPQNTKVWGLAAILHIAPNDIFGALGKYFIKR